VPSFQFLLLFLSEKQRLEKFNQYFFGPHHRNFFILSQIFFANFFFKKFSKQTPSMDPSISLPNLLPLYRILLIKKIYRKHSQ